MSSMKPSFLSPKTTGAIVLGAHDWTKIGLGQAPSYLGSAREIVSYFRGGLELGQDYVLDLFNDPAEASAQLVRVYDTLVAWSLKRQLTDVIIYYIGHALLDDLGHLAVLLKSSRNPLEVQTAIRAPDLASTLQSAAPQQRRIVILDCCFSEAATKAFIGMGDLSQAVAKTALKDFKDDNPKRGTVLLCSSSARDISIGVPHAERTLFTGCMLDVLRNGVGGYPPYLSFKQLRAATFERIKATQFGAGAPGPVLYQTNQQRGDLLDVPAFPNPFKEHQTQDRRFDNLPEWVPLQSDKDQLADLLEQFEKTRNEKLELVLEKVLMRPLNDSYWYSADNWEVVYYFAARAIKPDILKISWDRLHRGEENPFDQTLYTSEGQRMFDLVGKRYRSEPNFRTSIDNYLDECERKGDSLSSTVGALYTLIAHAAGRLGRLKRNP